MLVPPRPTGPAPRNRGLLRPAVAIPAALAIIAIAVLASYLAGQSGGSAAPRPTTVVTVTASPQSVHSPGNPAGTSSSSTSSPSGSPTSSLSVAPVTQGSGYSLQYSDSRFTMPGGGCQQGSPSSVSFSPQEPVVTTAGSEPGWWDLNTYCGSPVTLQTGNDQTAIVTGNPDAQACQYAIRHFPQTNGGIPFSQLKQGTQLCLTGGQNQSMIVHLTVLASSTTSYDLTFSATAWTIPTNS